MGLRKSSEIRGRSVGPADVPQMAADGPDFLPARTLETQTRGSYLYSTDTRAGARLIKRAIKLLKCFAHPSPPPSPPSSCGLKLFFTHTAAHG